MSYGLTYRAHTSGVHPSGAALNPLARATWLLFDRQGNLSPLVQSGATSMGWLFDSTGTLRARPHNLLLWSEQFDNAAWVKSGATVTANVFTAPDGLLTADKFVETTATSAHTVAQSPIAVTSGVTYTTSVFVRASERTRVAIWHSGAIAFSASNFDLAAGTKISGPGAITSVGNGWWRISRQDVATSTGNAQLVFALLDASGSATYTGDGTSGIFIWGAQLNQGDLQPYYPTSGAAFFGPRVSYDPANLSLGPFLLAEEQRTNGIRNNTMQGAVAGTPGTLPTNWSVFPTAGLARSVVGIGAENGINYIDVRINGTATATALSVFYFESNSGVAAVSGQTWTQSAYIKIVAGSLSGLSFVVGVDELNSSSGYLAGSVTAITPNATLSRVSHTRTLTDASTAFLRPFIYSNVANGAAIDITLRIGLPELSQGVIRPWSPPILTYGTAVTRSADNVTVPNLAATGFNAAEGTLYADFGPYGAGAAQGTSGNFGILGISDGTFQNGHLLFAGSGISPVYNPRVGNTSSAYISAGILSAGSRNRVAAAYSVAGFARAHNGNAPTTSAAAPLPTGLTVMNIGRLPAIVGNLDGRIYQAAIIPQRVSDSGLQRMTRI